MQEIDIRDKILYGISARIVTAAITAAEEGMVVETATLAREAEMLGLTVQYLREEGSRIQPGQEIVRMEGRPRQIAMAEERLMGIIAKPSGIATAARRFVDKAGTRPQIVSGAWKKMPYSQKDVIRRAILCGGARCRIFDGPFLYFDKNYLRMFGGIRPALTAVSDMTGYHKVIQLQGEYGPITQEACDAAEHGAGTVFIDTGRIDDIAPVLRRLNQGGWRDKVRIAFGGGIRLEDVDRIKTLDVDILDIGRPIIDAPLLDMRLEVLDVDHIVRTNG